MAEKKFSIILLTDTGDFLLEEEDQLERHEQGVEVGDPFIFNEDEKAQQTQAERLFIPYSSVQNIQYGDFEQETV